MKLLPLVSRKIKNWPTFMYHYALGLTPGSPYVFRNGARIKIGRGVDHAPIIEIFLREDYGKMPDNSVIVDLGANIGAFTVYATTTARNVTVLAYEPLTAYFDLMNENVAINKQKESVKCFNIAVAGEMKPKTLYVKDTDFFFPTFIGEQGQESIEVECTTLSNIIESNALDRVDVLKIDCEGAEYEILYSTPLQYFERIREIRMEYHILDSGQRHIKRLREFLSETGYTVTRVQPSSETNGSLWARR